MSITTSDASTKGKQEQRAREMEINSCKDKEVTGGGAVPFGDLFEVLPRVPGSKKSLVNVYEEGAFEKVETKMKMVIAKCAKIPVRHDKLFWLLPITRVRTPEGFVMHKKKERISTMRMGDILSAWMQTGETPPRRISRGVPLGNQGNFPNCFQMYFSTPTVSAYCKVFETSVNFGGNIEHISESPTDVVEMTNIIGEIIGRAQRILSFAVSHKDLAGSFLQLFRSEGVAPRIPTFKERSDFIVTEEECIASGWGAEDLREFMDAICDIGVDLPTFAALRNVLFLLFADLDASVSANPPDPFVLEYFVEPALVTWNFDLGQRIDRRKLSEDLIKLKVPWLTVQYVCTIHAHVVLLVQWEEGLWPPCASCGDASKKDINVMVGRDGKVSIAGKCSKSTKTAFGWLLSLFRHVLKGEELDASGWDYLYKAWEEEAIKQ